MGAKCPLTTLFLAHFFLFPFSHRICMWFGYVIASITQLIELQTWRWPYAADNYMQLKTCWCSVNHNKGSAQITDSQTITHALWLQNIYNVRKNRYFPYTCQYMVDGFWFLTWSFTVYFYAWTGLLLARNLTRVICEWLDVRYLCNLFFTGTTLNTWIYLWYHSYYFSPSNSQKSWTPW